MKVPHLHLKISGLALIVILLSCNGQPTQEMLAREKAMNKIKEAEEAIDEYLTLIEQNYKLRLDNRMEEISEVIEELSKELKDQEMVKKTEDRINILQEQRRRLTQKMKDMKSYCEGGCDDFSDRIDQIFKELDDHLSVLDSLLISV
jgi:chromosome segregation ATPase